MATAAGEGKIYSATYSNVPVYEFKFGSESVMRRRVDDWINATHILKAAGLDKPSRTRILEREVQKGVHEKIQGGYGKYQGTWVPLPEGRALAGKNNVLDRLRPIFDYVPGDKSPPPAPKHTNAASSRPRAPRIAAANRRPVVAAPVPPPEEPSSSFMAVNQPVSQSFNQEHYAVQPRFEQTYDEESQAPSVASSVVDEEDTMVSLQHSRKRKRAMEHAVTLSIIEQQHIMYGDALLDYFMAASDAPTAAKVDPPVPPPNFQANRPIDEQGNTALHWACAMGDLDIIRDLIGRGADIHCLSSKDETPLVRAVLFTNNYDRRTMVDLTDILKQTISFRDWFGATVFNHLAQATRSKGKWKSSGYYARVLIEKLREMYPPNEVDLVLSSQDSNGETAAIIAAKHGCLQLATTLISHCPESGDIPNKDMHTANEILMHITRQMNKGKNTDMVDDQDDEVDREFLNYSSEPLTSPYNRRRYVSQAAEHTGGLVQRVGGIMEEAGTRLFRVYGQAPRRRYTLNSQDSDDEVEPEEAVDNDEKPAFDDLRVHSNDDPLAMIKKIDEERVSLKEQADVLSKHDARYEPFNNLHKRWTGVRSRHEDIVERMQRVELARRVKKMKLAHTNGTTDAAAAEDSEAAANLALDSEDAFELYQSAIALTNMQIDRQGLVSELIHQRSDTGAPAHMDSHRKLVVLATGMREDEVDPMAAGIAETLEFEKQLRGMGRARLSEMNLGIGMAVPANGGNGSGATEDV